MQDQTARELIESFQGPNGKADLYEVVRTNPDRPYVEQVEYEIVFNGHAETRLTVGEASIRACELSGDPRFAAEVVESGHSNL